MERRLRQAVGSSTGALGVATGDTGAVGAGAANSGLSASSIGQSALTGAGKGALVGGLKAAATGQDPLTGALTGAATGAVGGSLGSVGTQLTGSNIIGGVAGGVGGGATGAAINNKDIGTGALIGGLSGGTTAGINSITDSNLGSTIAPLTGATIGSLVNTGSLPSFLSGLSGSSSTPTASGSTPTTNTASADTTNSNTLGGVALPVAKTIKGSQISIPQTTYASESSVPVYQPTYNPQSLSEIQNAKDGGIIHMASGGEFPRAQGLLHGGTANYFQGVSPLSHAPTSLLRLADGGDVQSDDIAQHNPTFFSEGGLDSLDNTYVQGDGDGTSDDVAAMLADGEFVIPADCVSKLGNGSSNAGAKVLDEFLATIREHKQKHDPKQLPPDSKGPLGYLLKAKQKAKA